MDESACIWLGEIEHDLHEIKELSDPAFVKSLAGMHRDEARAKIVSELKHLGSLEKIEPHTLQVPIADRGGAIVEPRLTLQWYCDAATLAQPAIKAVETSKIIFEPRQWENTFSPG